jgi:HK97 family phage major capsid protein
MAYQSSKAMLERRGELVKTIETLNEKIQTEQRDFTEQETEEWKKANDEFDQLTKENGPLERALRVERVKANAPEHTPALKPEEVRSIDTSKNTPSYEFTPQGPTVEQRAMAMQGWLLVGAEKQLSERHLEACRACDVNPQGKVFNVSFCKRAPKSQAEVRALSVVTGSAGQNTIPQGFVRQLEMAMLDYSGVRQVASVMRTDSGNPMPWPTVNDTGNEGRLLAENTQITETDPAFGQLTWAAYKYTSDSVLVPVELLEDSAFNLAEELGNMLGERLGRITNRHFTTGTGTGQPQGIVSGATAGVTAASATAFTFDEVLSLVHSIDPAYRQNAAFMMHDNVLLALRKLKTGTGEYLWQADVQQGTAGRLLGYPVYTNQHMASSIATGNKVMIFGQLNRYKIRDVANLRLVRMNERYADYDQVGFVAFSRHDGRLLDAGTHPVKYLAMA